MKSVFSFRLYGDNQSTNGARHMKVGMETS
jgi:hypothetical protein